MDLGDLAGSRFRELERLFCAGSMPDADDLVGWEYRGFVPGPIPRVVRFQKFVKGLFAGPDGPEGYNVWCSQRDWRRLSWRGRPMRHSFYVVRPAEGRRKGLLLLDYGASRRNPRWWPLRLFRDLVVHPDPDNRDLILGKAYLKLGALIPLGFFLLERDRQIP